MINIKSFDPDFLKIDKKSYKNIDIYYNGYIKLKIIGDYESSHSVNLLYFIIDKIDGYIEENNVNKYLIFASTDENKKILTKYTELWNKMKNWIEKINVKPGETQI